MSKLLFNRNPLNFSREIDQPSMNEVKDTPALWNASIDDALKFGGDLTRAAIGAMNLRGDRKHIIVDTKIHMLMPGFMPAIPGWHTDGVPRGYGRNPNPKLPPDIWRQEDEIARPPRFHLLVTGLGCLTDFVTDPLELDVPDEPTADLYKIMSHEVNGLIHHDLIEKMTIPSCTVVEWDWWNIHTAVPATAHEWRYLIRVCETDYCVPQTDLRQVMRTQQQVYVPQAFGW